jgi:hypothetical protein
MSGECPMSMTSLLYECVATLNRLGLGEFSVRQVMWKATIFFNSVEIAWADTNRRQFNCASLKFPLSIPDPPDTLSKNIILNSLLSCGIAIKVFCDQWQEAHFIGILNEFREWAVVPPNAATHPFLISLPPLGTWNGDEPYEVKLIVYPFPREEPKIIRLKPSELPTIHEISQIIALTRL